jgi:hypothetical protein
MIILAYSPGVVRDWDLQVAAEIAVVVAAAQVSGVRPAASERLGCFLGLVSDAPPGRRCAPDGVA